MSEQIAEGDGLISLDLRNGFCHIPVHKDFLVPRHRMAGKAAVCFGLWDQVSYLLLNKVLHSVVGYFRQQQTWE